MTTANAIFLLGLLVMAVGLMAMAYILRKPFLSFGAAMGWVLVGVYAYTLSVAAWDIFYGLFWFAMGLVVLSVLEAMSLRERGEPPQEEKPKSDWERFLDKQEKDLERHAKYERYRRKWDMVLGSRRRRQKAQQLEDEDLDLRIDR